MFRGIFMYTEDRCTVKFKRSHHCICLKKLQLKVQHSGSHGIMLDLDLTSTKGEITYKSFERLDNFLSFDAYVTFTALCEKCPYSEFF